MHVFVKCIFAVITIGFIVPIAFAAGPSDPRHTGSIINGSGGAFLDNPGSVFVAGNYAYVVSLFSNALEIVDVSNPAAPHHEGSIINGAGGAFLGGPSCVFVAGNYAYVTSGFYDALEIVDVSNPAAPSHRGCIVNGSGGAFLDNPRSVFVAGNYAYVASSGSDALEIVDVSNPAAPHHEGSIVNGSGGAFLDGAESVFVAGNYAYVASSGSDALEIVDISNPAAPSHKGCIVNGSGGAFLDNPGSVFVAGNYAYVVSFFSNALEIVDVSNPAAPSHRGYIVKGGSTLLGNPRSVFVAGNYAFVASYFSDALEIVDVSSPAAPHHEGSIISGIDFALLDGAYSVYVAGNYAYVVSINSNALEIVDIGDYSGIGVFRPSTHTFSLDSNNNGVWNGASREKQYNFGLSGDLPVTGDWGYLNILVTDIGVFRPSTHTFYLDYNENGRWDGPVTDRAYNFGMTGDIPVTGDWFVVSDLLSKIGVFRPSTHTFYLDYNGNGRWDGVGTDQACNFGLTGDKPVTGDWDNDGITEIGVFRPSTHTFYLDYNGNGRWDGPVTDRAYNFGLTGDIPVTGDWNSDHSYEIGVFRPSTHTFYLDYNRNGAWSGSAVDRAYNFGITGDSPVSGIWD